MQHFRRWCRFFASLLLIVAVATLLQGVGHEIFHETGDLHSHAATETLTCGCHAEDCHSDHHTCSSLSCSQGASFISAAGFNFLHIATIEFFRPDRSTFALPLITEDFFKPPINPAC